MNQLPRNMKLTAFDPHRPEFECVHEATKVPPIDPEAQEWFEQGLVLSNQEWYEDDDWVGAAALWHKAAERQHWKAMMNLASLYANGRGEGKLRVERDLERAVLITEEAMQLGIPAAFDFMGTLHWEGRGVNGDASRAYAFWQLAADMGSPSAMAYLGKALDATYNNPQAGFWENRTVALKMLGCGLAQGHGQAAYELGLALNGNDASLGDDYGRALAALHSAVKFGNAKAADALSVKFRTGQPIVGRAIDRIRADRYGTLGDALRRNPDLRFPNLDKVLPLPPAVLPPWDGQRQSLIDAAKGVRLAPQPLTTSAHQLPPHDRAHIPPGPSVQLPPELANPARRTPLEGITTVWLGSRYSSDVTRAPHTGYWQARVLPDRPHHNPRAPQLRSEFAQLPPLRFQQGEFMRLTMGHTDVPHEDWVHDLVDWHFVGVALPQRLPPDWLARADLVHALTTATRTTCLSGERCPQSGIWQPYALDKAHPAAPLLSTAVLNENWKRQAFVQQGERMPRLGAQGLPVEDDQVGWWLMQACEVGSGTPITT
ncbi:MAG: sel1 repeat family protein [Hydrogenophaga sp.]|uniref:tetratricopeptide repeat protein n=1 Tax=Hydrogenophaga sp. TaxID=1904254 RepID=UPI0025BA9791|nr:tetratricopeptide repeat protein [Hydrogenophaga sp.]MBU7572506.1 sel1 repeat family protein [Hydrogenophaga sp.]